MSRVPLKSMTIQYENYDTGTMIRTKIKSNEQSELDSEIKKYLKEFPYALYGTIIVETAYTAGKYYAFLERAKKSDRP